LEASDALRQISTDFGVTLSFEEPQKSVGGWAVFVVPDGIWYSDLIKNKHGYPLAALTAMHEHLHSNVGVNIGYRFYNMPAGSVTVDNFPWMLRCANVGPVQQLNFMKS